MTIKKLLLFLSAYAAFSGIPSALIATGDPSGFTNVGSSCFMNAALQCLYAMDDFSELIVSHKDNAIPGSFALKYADFIGNIDKTAPLASAPNTVLNPLALHFWQAVNENPHTALDADEFLTFTLNRLTDGDLTDATRATLTCYQNSQVPQSPLSDLFYAQISSGYGDDNHGALMQPSAILTLPMRNTESTLFECLQNFSNGDLVEYPVGSGTMVAKRNLIEHAGTYLILNIQRGYTQGIAPNVQMGRRNNALSFPLAGLDIRPHMVAGAQPQGLYDLTAIIMHSGNQNGGHYTAYVKAEGNWYYCDDARVVAISQPNMERIAQQGFGPNNSIVPATFVYRLANVPTVRRNRAAPLPVSTPAVVPVLPARTPAVTIPVTATAPRAISGGRVTSTRQNNVSRSRVAARALAARKAAAMRNRRTSTTTKKNTRTRTRSTLRRTTTQRVATRRVVTKRAPTRKPITTRKAARQRVVRR